MSIGNELKRLRKQKNLSISELARRSNISQPYLSQLETGRNNNPTIDAIKGISIGLGMNFTHLMIELDIINKNDLCSFGGDLNSTND